MRGRTAGGTRGHHVAPLSAYEIYDIGCRGNVAEIDSALQRFPSEVRLRHPFAIALRGVRSAVGGDVPGGIALLRRAVGASEHPDKQFLIDLLLPYVVSVGEIDVAEELLDFSQAPVPELLAGFLAFRSIFAARRGEQRPSRTLASESLEAARSLDDRAMTGRALQRLAYAAFYREDFEEAQERALEAARAGEALHLFRLAATSYSFAYSVAREAIGDPDVARLYAERMTFCAERARDVAMQNVGLIMQLEIAASTGDHRRLGSIRGRLLANARNGQYRERFSFILSEALLNGWVGRFEPARAIVASAAQSEHFSFHQRSLCEAMLGLFDAARGDVAAAKSRAHRVLSRTAHHPSPESPVEGGFRRIARIVAACTCIVVGDVARGRRGLPPSVDPEQAFARLATAKTLDEGDVPPMTRGYARLINAVAAAVARHQAPLGLTATELRVLRALPAGATLDEIALSFGTSRKAIARHVEGIYAKLGVSNRVQAVHRARDLRIDL